MEHKTCCSIIDKQSRYYFVAVVFGLCSGYFDISFLTTAASTVSDIFMQFIEASEFADYLLVDSIDRFRNGKCGRG